MKTKTALWVGGGVLAAAVLASLLGWNVLGAAKAAAKSATDALRSKTSASMQPTNAQQQTAPQTPRAPQGMSTAEKAAAAAAGAVAEKLVGLLGDDDE